MSRQSPSGPGVITDKFNTIGAIDPGSMPPGVYVMFPSILGVLFSGGALIPIAGIDEDTSAILGVETRDGKIGKTRVKLLALPGTAGSDPIILQWNVNGVPVGTPVEIPWTTVPALPATYVEACEAISGEQVLFPGAVWEAGQVVILQVTLGTLVGLDGSLIVMALEKNYP